MTAQLHRLAQGPVDLTAIPTVDTPTFSGGLKHGKAANRFEVDERRPPLGEEGPGS